MLHHDKEKKELSAYPVKIYNCAQKTNKILYCKVIDHYHQWYKTLIKHSAQTYFVVQSKETQ